MMGYPVRNISVLGRTFAVEGREIPASPAYDFILDFEYWDPEASMEFIKASWWKSIPISIAYIALSLIAERLLSKPVSGLRLPLIAWNLLLAAFSFVAFFRLAPELIFSLRYHGFHYSICDNSYARKAPNFFWLEMFGWSKLAELGDTAFLVFKKRPLTALHLWHHASVYVFTWHACRWHVASGKWFGTMNTGVHAAMYLYFAAKAFGWPRLPRSVSVALTTAQIAQMLTGVSITARVWWIKAHGGDCDHEWVNLHFSLAIYLSYAVLFLRFFAQTYLRKAKTD